VRRIDRHAFRRVAAAALAAALGGCNDIALPTAPSSTQTTIAPGRTDVTIAADGVVLGGYLYRPASTEARPAVILLHGWQAAGTVAAALVEGRARRLSDEGYVVLAISMRGWPPSGGADDCGLRQPDDVVAAAAWLRAQPGAIADRVGLIGFSQGGQVALLAAARDPRIRSVVAYFPVTDVGRWKETTANRDIPGYITAVCEPGGAAARSPLMRAVEMITPVLLLHGDADTRVPAEQSVLLDAARDAAGRSTELFLVPGAQHGFTSAEEALVQPVVDRFLARTLR
jgi:dipeptidyl aminopeptidase/acylaminoacyl peptidase